MHLAEGTADGGGAEAGGLGCRVRRYGRGEEHRRGPGVAEDAVDFAGGLARVHRQRDGAHARGGKEGGDTRRRVLDQHSDTVARLHPGRAEVPGDGVAGGVEVAIGPVGAAGIADRARVGARGDLCREIVVPVCGHLEKSALRFSRKAEMPSPASSPPWAMAMASRSRSSCSASVVS